MTDPYIILAFYAILLVVIIAGPRLLWWLANR